MRAPLDVAVMMAPTMDRHVVHARIWLLALTVALLTVGVGAGSATAALVGYRFNITPGATCVGGYGVAGETLTVVLRARDGARLARRTLVVTSDNGFFQACLGTTISPGMTLVLKGTYGGHTAVVPRFDARVDRVTNRLTGHAPPGTQLQGMVNECYPRRCGPTSLTPFHLTATSEGDFSTDLGVDIDGQDFVALSFQTLAGDRIITRASAPYLVVRQPTAAAVRLWPSASGEITVTLRTAAGKVRARTTRSVTRDRSTTFAFRRDGRAVRIRAGDRITSDLAADANLTVPGISLDVDVPGASVSGRCFASEWYSITWGPSLGDSTFSVEQANADGTFTVALPQLERGWIVEVLCEDAHGDQLRLKRVVP